MGLRLKQTQLIAQRVNLRINRPAFPMLVAHALRHLEIASLERLLLLLDPRDGSLEHGFLAALGMSSICCLQRLL